MERARARAALSSLLCYGPLEVHLLDFATALTRLELCESGEEKEIFQALGAALRSREDLVRGVGTTAFRLVHGRIDGFEGLTIDVYDDTIVLECHLETGAGLAVERALARVVTTEGALVVKDRWKRDPEAKFGRLAAGRLRTPTAIVIEEGLRLEVELLGQEHSGLFLDARSARRVVRSRCKGRRVLNLFCYTGAFGVAAAKGGARSTTNVDLRGTHAARISRNYALNNLPFDSRGFLRDDAARFLSRTVKSGYRYDLVIMDPTRFSKITNKRNFDVKTNYVSMLSKALQALSDGGQLLASNGAGTLPDASLVKIIEQAAYDVGRQISQMVLLEPDADCPPGSDRPTGRFIWVELSKECRL